MVSRKRKRYEEEEGGEEQGEGQGRGDEGIVTRRMSAGRMSTRSDMVVVQPSPTEPRRATTNGGDKFDGISVKEVNRIMGNRQSNGPSTPTTTPPVEREKTVTLDLSNIKNVRSAKASGENTPIRSTNGSISGTSAIQKPHGKSLRSKGSISSSSGSSSDHEDMLSQETLPQLTSSLKLAQSRASSLSTNFSRLMRLVLDEELEAIDREIAQVKNGGYELLKDKYREASEECETKKQIAKARLIAAEHEIDIRFGANVDTEWQHFRSDKLELREQMCTDIASRISSLQVETDEARLLNVGVKPASALQQAPWWVKIPKQLTWLNLPDGVNDDQRDKDLARMGILNRPPPPSPDSYGIRTPSPEYIPRKRRRRDRVREWHDDYGSYGDWDNSYAHLAEPPPPPPSLEMDVREDDPVGGGGSSMMSLLQVVEDDMRMQLGPPPQLTWPKNREVFVTYPSRPGVEYRTPLLPRPPMMPPDMMANNYVPRHYIPPIRPAKLPPLRFDSNDSNTKLTVPPMETNTPAIQSQQPDMHPEGSVPQTSPPLLRKPSIDPLHSSAFIPDYPQQITPKPIAPRPGSVPTPIQPSPVPSRPSRPGSSSPDLLRKQRLLPKTLATSHPQTLATSHSQTPPPREEDRPPYERFPLQRLNERPAADSVSPPCAAPPPPAPNMGRFLSLGDHPEATMQSNPANPKVAIPRLHETPVPLKIAPAPAKRVDMWTAEVKTNDGTVSKDGSVKSVDGKGETSPAKEPTEKGEERKAEKEGEGEGEENGKEIGRPGLRSRKRHV